MYYFIFNPAAGAGRSKKALQVLEEYCHLKSVDYKVAYSEYPGHSIKLAQQAVGKGYDGIISVGGDGTILEIAEALKNTDETLGIIPAGTGNDFKYAIGVPQDTQKAFDIILEGNKKRIDIGLLNEEKCFLNIAGTGFDVDVIKNTNRVRRFITGSAAYYIGIVLSLFGYKFAKLKLTIDGKKLERTALLVAAANGRCYGGGLFVNPKADLSDGLLKFVVINKISKPRILVELPKLQKAHPEQVKELEEFTCSEVLIESERPLTFNVDGDIYGSTPMSIRILKNALNVFCAPE